MVSPDRGQSSQESDATEPDAAEVDGAALTPSPQPSQDEDVLPSGTPDGQNDLDAEQPVSRGNAATSSPGAGEEVIPLSDSPAPERFSEPTPPRSEEPDWPEISPPQNRQVGFQRFQQPYVGLQSCGIARERQPVPVARLARSARLQRDGHGRRRHGGQARRGDQPSPAATPADDGVLRGRRDRRVQRPDGPGRGG